MTSIQSSVINSAPLTTARPQTEATVLRTQWQGMAPRVGMLRVNSIRALLIELGSLEFQAFWTIEGNGEICGNHASNPAESQFPGMITVVSRIASAPAGEMLTQCRSLQQWVFGWRTDERHVIVTEANFRTERSDMNESDMATLRLLVESSLGVYQSSTSLPSITSPADHYLAPVEQAPKLPTTSALEIPEPTQNNTEKTALATNMPVFQAPLTVAQTPPTSAPKTEESPVRKERKAVGPSSPRKTIAIPVGQRRETSREEIATRNESPLSEADTLIAFSDVERQTTDKTKTPDALQPKEANALTVEGQQTTLSASEKDTEGEFPSAYSETAAWPKIKPPAAKRAPLISTLGLILAIICTLFSLWIAAVAVPETMASYQADAQRRRTISDQTMIRDLSMAMASGDYGDVQTALSSFASLGYFESALVSNTRKRVVAQAGLDTGIRIGDETPPDVKKFARTIDLILANESQGQLLLLHEGSNEEQQNGLMTIQIGAIVVGVLSFLCAMLVAFRLYRRPLARLLLRNR